MRVDVFTSQDRANQAAAAYKEYQFSRFIAWCTGGSIVTALLIVFGLMWLFPSYFQLQGDLAGANPNNLSLNDPRGILTYIVSFPLLLIASPRILVVGGILFALLFILSFIFSRLVSFYQGIFGAVISFFISWGVFWAILKILGLQSVNTVSLIIAGVIGSIAFLLGFLGVFLPDA